jgi:hypothetical protein
MAARDHFTIKLACPSCGQTGTAQVSEDDYPFMSSPRFSVDELPEPFVVTTRAETLSGTVISCTECNVRVR